MKYYNSQKDPATNAVAGSYLFISLTSTQSTASATNTFDDLVIPSSPNFPNSTATRYMCNLPGEPYYDSIITGSATFIVKNQTRGVTLSRVAPTASLTANTYKIFPSNSVSPCRIEFHIGTGSNAAGDTITYFGRFLNTMIVAENINNFNMANGNSITANASNCIITGANNGVHGQSIILNCNNSNSTGVNNILSGEWLVGTGENNIVCGDSNQFLGDGDNNIIAGDNNFCYGTDNIINGTYNTSTGDCNIVIGTKNLNTGNNNAIFGVGNTSSGAGNLVTGSSNINNSDYSLVCGILNNISGSEQMILGSSNIVSGGSNNFVAGQNNVVSGSHNNVISYGSSLNGSYNYILGDFNIIKDDAEDNILIGAHNTAENDSNTAIGEFISITGQNNLITGSYHTISGDYNFIFGDHHTVTGDDKTIFGKYGTDAAVLSYGVGLGGGTAGNLDVSVRIQTTTFGSPSAGSGDANAWRTGGADYAEYFEWNDGNINSDDRIGYFVEITNGEKIKISENEDCLGIVSGTAGIIGDSAWSCWSGKGLKDQFGRLITKEVIDDKGNVITVSQQSTNYNSDNEYIERKNRKEWDTIGLLGKIFVRDNGECEVNKYCKCSTSGIAIPASTNDKYKWRVIKRSSTNVIRIYYK